MELTKKSEGKESEVEVHELPWRMRSKNKKDLWWKLECVYDRWLVRFVVIPDIKEGSDRNFLVLARATFIGKEIVICKFIFFGKINLKSLVRIIEKSYKLHILK